MSSPYGFTWTPARYDRSAAMTAVNISRRTRTAILPLQQHGTRTAYKKGCACEACREANRDAQRRKRA